MTVRARNRKMTMTLLAAAVALATAAGAAGLATLATGYSSAASSSANVTTGTVTIGAGTANSLTTSISGLEPGDKAYRVIDVTSTSTLLTSVTLNTTDTYVGSQLSTTTVGLQMTVDRCAATGFTQAGTTPAFTYTCPGGAVNLIASRDVLTGTPISLGSSLSAVQTGSALPTTDHLLITLTLPTTSPSSAQSAQSGIKYTFAGVQRTTPASR